MASITVRVGREEKEISGLTKRTTCWDVVLALLKDKQNVSGTDGFSADGERQNSAGNIGDETGSATSSTTKSIKELAQSYCIVESWRGWEKPIPPRTRILQVMQIIEKQRGEVYLSLKKSKHIAYSNFRQVDLKSDANGHLSPTPDDQNSYAARLSQHQKRRIRRNLKQYKRAVMSKGAEGVKSEDYINNNKHKTDTCNKNVTLSKELFVDGVVCDSLVRPDRAELINLGAFNQEYCTYRRKGRHRAGSIDSTSSFCQDSALLFPYSHHHRRRRSRRGSSKRGKRRYSTDDTSTTTTTTTNSSAEENAEDADDEKSIMTEQGCTNNLRLPRSTYNPSLGTCMENVITELSTTATDSSTTTSGESISSNGCSTTSSEASSWGDCALDRSIREYCANNGVNFKPGVIHPPQRFLRNTEQVSSETFQKPKKSKSLLGLIETFRQKSNSKKNSKSNKKSQNKKISSPIIKNHEKTDEKVVNATTENIIEITPPSPTDGKPTAFEDEDKDAETRDQLLQTLLAQNNILNTQKTRLAESDVKIEQIETDIHQLREQAHGKNYVQNAYMSEASESSETYHNVMSSSCGQPATLKWILDSECTESLGNFIETSNEIVKVQMQIEENQRKVDIILQDMQEEVWRVSTEGGCSPTRVSSATAALVFGKFEEEDADSEDETTHGSLSVCNSSNQDKKEETKSLKSKKEGVLSVEVETLRTELETSLYFSLRLTSELDEVDHRLGASDNLIHHKGEELIQTVRELAMSEEGISPELWDEYGDLLTAYDIEIQQREYLEIIEAAEALASSTRVGKAEKLWPESEDYRIDATSPNPIIHMPETHNHPEVHFGQNLPTMRCEHCKIEENLKHGNLQKISPQVQNATKFYVPPKSFSDLPLPHLPNVVGQNLLPMLPVSIESDNDELDSPRLPIRDVSNESPSSDISSKPFCSTDTLPSSSSNSTDDSGNASAESTSGDGSPNSSCDGESPRPQPDDKTSFFGRNSSIRGSWKDKFSFPGARKPEAQSLSLKHSKVPPPPPPQSAKPTNALKPPKLPPKPQNARRASTSSPNLVASANTLQQQQRLIRRNTSGRSKARFNSKQNFGNMAPSSSNLTSFGNRGGSFRDGRIKNLSLPFPDAKNNSRSNTPVTVVSVVGPSMAVPSKSRQQQANYDNDSDTGLSSLHSTDSDQPIYCETLV